MGRHAEMRSVRGELARLRMIDSARGAVHSIKSRYSSKLLDHLVGACEERKQKQKCKVEHVRSPAYDRR